MPSHVHYIPQQEQNSRYPIQVIIVIQQISWEREMDCCSRHAFEIDTGGVYDASLQTILFSNTHYLRK